MAGLFEGLWYRALIEDINLKCDDIVIFFVDYGNRELTSVQSIRTLSDDMMNLPAQAVRCALPKNTAMSELHVSMNETQLIHMQVDRVEQGGVGRLDGQELTLWITLYAKHFVLLTFNSLFAHVYRYLGVNQRIAKMMVR